MAINSNNRHSPHESSITVCVRVRPFTVTESSKLISIEKQADIYAASKQFLGCSSSTASSSSPISSDRFSISKFGPHGIRKVVNVVDEKMLIFDPMETNPLHQVQKSLFPRSTARAREHKFSFDRLFDEDSTQDDVYFNTSQPLLDSVLEGYNATVFAYGATGCGKTHTITGTHENPGIIFSTAKELFERIEFLRTTKDVNVSISYLEIYNETIRDLLNPDTDPKLLGIREDENKKISVRNLSTHVLTTVAEIMDLIIIGNQNRTVNSTAANATSSRSHAVLQINIDQKDRSSGINEEHFYSTLSIIDLAGSERASATHNVGKRLNEGANINRSLLALGNCINALCDPKRRNHVPYRDSKLTRLLKFSLGGNCKTVMIVCISPSSEHYDETLNTLKYANRAKEIKTKVSRNTHNLDRHVSSYLKMITEQKQEIEELRSRETKIIEMNLNRYKNKREKCLQNSLETIDQIKKSTIGDTFKINHIGKLMAKRKVLQTILLQLENFNRIFGEHYKSKFVSTPPELAKLQATLIDKIQAIHNQIEATHQMIETEKSIIDESILKVDRISSLRLKVLETWNESDSLILDSLIENIRQTFAQQTLAISDTFFENFMKNDEFAKITNELTDLSFTLLKKLAFINTTTDIESIKNQILLLINNLIGKILNILEIENNLDKLLTVNSQTYGSSQGSISPKKANRNSLKTRSIRSPTKSSHHKVKKVRWDSNVVSGIKTNADSSDGDDDSDDGNEDIHNYDNTFNNNRNLDKKHDGGDLPKSSINDINNKKPFDSVVKPPALTSSLSSLNFENKLLTNKILQPCINPISETELTIDEDSLVEKENSILQTSTPDNLNDSIKTFFDDKKPLFSLFNKEKKFEIGTPARISKPLNKDKFNFEQSFSGDIQMLELE